MPLHRRSVRSGTRTHARRPDGTTADSTVRHSRHRLRATKAGSTCTTARVLLHVLSSLRTAALDERVAAIGLDATRRALLGAFRPLAGAVGALAALTVLLGKVVPGLRVM